ncbi:SUF system NifU family Fe-S cluster assembly protein [Thiospirochaeta perfilievii]|uniref:SUF system NifU family Fe-S cluster assembly protein n=1 Tax=Thiospirochaeta perfilievii TaxID=252967 RepID=A0A5C1QB68_9SPIO|nr:SUF system NifU family Fe-S cluster assembly protein [Thiospirochaeta perfilievii]QEN04109.1 SUF system NifU family Fe-S cluster assembly protein [Thiospirochaeta perfilievii]
MSLYKETLMKHFRDPQFKRELTNYQEMEDGVNPSCGDNITLYLNKNDNIIEEISFTGNGCAISMASADILCSIITKTTDPKAVILEFIQMITGGDITFKDDLEVLNVFKEMQNFPARRSCAILPWKTLEKVLS